MRIVGGGSPAATRRRIVREIAVLSSGWSGKECRIRRRRSTRSSLTGAGPGPNLRRLVRIVPEQRLAEQPLLLVEEVADHAVAVEQDAVLRLHGGLARRRGDASRQLDGARHQLVGGVDRSDDPDAEGAGGVEQAAGEGELRGDRGGEGGTRGRVARRYPAGQLREAEARLLGREPQVAEERQGEAAGEGGAVDGGDHRFEAAADGPERADARLDELLPVGAVASELVRVHAGAEGRRGTGQHDGPDLGVLAERAEGIRELDAQVDGERVSLLRTL